MPVRNNLKDWDKKVKLEPILKNLDTKRIHDFDDGHDVEMINIKRYELSPMTKLVFVIAIILFVRFCIN